VPAVSRVAISPSFVQSSRPLPLPLAISSYRHGCSTQSFAYSAVLHFLEHSTDNWRFGFPHCRSAIISNINDTLPRKYAKMEVI
jgi:hypothetical protein